MEPLQFFGTVFGILLGVVVLFCWCFGPPVHFYSDLSERQRQVFYNFSRRQKIIIGILAGPISLILVLWNIFSNDTKPFWKYLGKVAVKYFNLLK